MYDGYLDMRFVFRDGRTIAERLYREGNSRVSAALTAGAVPVHFLIATGGGYLEGENYQQTLTLGPDSHAIIASQTPNYIYKCEQNKLTVQESNITVGRQATLEYYLDEVVPYENAKYLQETAIHLDEGACLILTDGLTAGWSADDQPFTYQEVTLKTRVTKAGQLIFNDHLLSRPSEQEMAQLGYFEGMRNFNSVLIVDDDLTDERMAELQDYLESLETTCRYGLTSISGGLVLRLLGMTYHDNRQLMWAFISYYREMVKGFEPIRTGKLV